VQWELCFDDEMDTVTRQLSLKTNSHPVSRWKGTFINNGVPFIHLYSSTWTIDKMSGIPQTVNYNIDQPFVIPLPVTCYNTTIFCNIFSALGVLPIVQSLLRSIIHDVARGNLGKSNDWQLRILEIKLHSICIMLQSQKTMEKSFNFMIALQNVYWGDVSSKQ
jgi:hypothetical protein